MSYMTLIDKLKIANYFKSKHTQTGMVAFDPELCTSCGICTRICPARAIELVANENGKKFPSLVLLTKDEEIKSCMACGDCMAACPSDAISILQGYNSRFYFKKVAQVEQFAFPRKY